MFYNIYADLCAKKGVSLSKAAESIGVNRAAVSKWKDGATPNGETIQKFADFFGVSTDYLLEKEKAPTDNDERKDEIGFNDFTYAMHNETKDLPQEKKDMLLEMARFMKRDLEREKK